MTTGLAIPILHGAFGTSADERDTVETAASVADALRRLGHRPEIIALDLDLNTLARLAASQPAVVFNLVECLRGDSRLSVLASTVLDHFDVAYTGARTEALVVTLSKRLTKEILRARGLPTPDWWMSGADVPADRTVIVKSETEHASVGLDAQSVVAGRKAAATMRKRAARFGGRFFAEDFIDGREFNIAILEGEHGASVLPIPEMRFVGFSAGRPRIVDYETKWDATSPTYRQTERRFGLERAEPRLAERLRTLALACWEVFDLSGYARVDIRLAAEGNPSILEVNANPCLARDAGFAAAAAAAGLSYETLIGRILATALRAGRKTT